MPAPYSAGSIFLQVHPSFRGVPERIAREAREWGEIMGRPMDQAMEKAGVEAVRKASPKISKEMDKAGQDAAEAFANRFISWNDRSKAKKFLEVFEAPAADAGKKAGEEYGGRFANAVRSAVQRASREVGTLKLDADDAKVQAKLRQLKRDLQALSGDADIGMDLDVGTVMEKLASVENALRHIQDNAGTIDMRVNSASALQEVAKVRGELMALSSIQIEPDLKLNRQLGAFERGFKNAVEGALRDLGTVDVGAGSNAGQRALADIRRQLIELGDQNIGVDISDETARERLNQLRDNLQQLQREHWGVSLDADTAAADAHLTGFLTVLEAIDGRHVDIDVDVKDAVSAITTLRSLQRQSGQTRDAVHGLNSEVGQDGANAFRAFNARVLGVAALGPLVVPAIGGIAGAIAALGPLAAAAGAGIGVLALGVFGLGDAFKAIGAARESSAKELDAYQKQVTSARRSVADAERGLAQARADAAQASEDASMRVADSLRGVEDAERQLASAQEDARRAQEDLTEARRDAAEQLEDLGLKARDGVLDERKAVLDLREAEDDLRSAREEGVTGDDMARTILAYDRAKLTLDQTRETNGDLREEQAKWAKEGVEGSDVVVAAHERVRSSQERIADAERGLADAQRDVARAREEQSRTAVDGQRAVADAQRTLTRAQQDYRAALAETSSSQQKLTTEMAKLGPAGQAFVKWLDSIRPRLQNLRSIAQAGFLPGLQNWLDALINNPYIDRGIERISSALGSMFDDFADSIRGPSFNRLFEMINRSGPRFIGYMSQILVNLGEGIAELIVAMEPLGDLFGGWLVDATARFRDWAAGLSGSTGLQDFFDWVERVGPKIARFFWNLADALLAIGKAVAPFAEGLLDVLSDAFAWIADLDPTTLRNVTIVILGLTVALQAIFGLTALIHSFRSAIHLVTEVVERFGKTGLAFLTPWLVLAAALFTLYTNSETFRRALNTLWHEVLEPLFAFLGDVLGSVLEPLFGFLGDNIEVVATIAAAWASWKIILQVVGWVGKLRAALGLLAISQAAVAATSGGGIMTGPGDTRRGVGTRGGIGGALLGLGGIGALATGVFAGANFAFDQNAQGGQEANDRWTRLFEQARAGGDAGAAAQQRLAQERNSFGNSGFMTFLDNIVPGTGVHEEFRNAAEGARDYWSALSPLEQAQQKVAEWTNTLADRQHRLGESSDLTAAAHRRLEYWTGLVETRERAAADATSGLNTELLEQQGLAIALADADIAYSQARDALDAAFQNYKKTLDDVNATDEERRAAEEQWTNQSRQTAEAAANVAKARHQNADAAEREAYGNAALLLDLERQKEQYGSLPPRLEELRESLAATIDPTVLAVAKMEELGLAVVGIPDNKTLVISGDTPQAQLDRLRELGFSVKELPDGSFEVTANTDEAAKALDEFIDTERTITIGAEVDWAFDRARRKPTTRNYGDAGFGDAGHAAGGFISGPGTWTSDSIPAWLSNGEYVMRAASVAKYGLEFFNALNQGRLGREATGFSRGGRARRKQGRLAFADGGLAVNWGGSMSLSGGDVSPLAAMWWQAVAEIAAAARAGVQIMGKTLGSFSTLTNNAFAGVARGVTASWTRLIIDLSRMTTKFVVDQLLQFGRLALGVINAADRTSARVRSIWGTMSLQLLATNTRLVGSVNLQFVTMSANVLRTVASLILGIKNSFDKLPRLVAVPVNTIIGRVINLGLVAAFNNIASQLGTGTRLVGPSTVKLAAGGKVPGSSPNRKADNIPAWLTAGEYVHPVDSVDYYGPEVMDALRKRRIPRELFSQMGYASGGYVAMGNIIKNQFPWARITSAYRPGDPGYHGRGLAVDIGGSAPWPDPTAIKQMLTINRWIASNFKNITELIHTAPGAINLWHGMPHQYNAATQAAHRNHVHWADQLLEPGSGGSFPGMLAGLGLALDPRGSLDAALAKGLKGFGTSPMHNILAAVPKKLADYMATSLDKIIATAAISITDSNIAARGLGGGSSVANRSLAQQLAAARGWVGGEWSALDTLIMKESGYNNLAQNPTSTAFGIGQFLNSTWASVGGVKTSDPGQQLEYMYRYIGQRYGTPSRALAFHLRNNYYGDGGPVQDVDPATGGIVPDLHDTGGWLMPGLNVVMNRTGRPEPTINPQTLDALQRIAADGASGSPLIGQYNQQMVAGSPKEAFEQLMHDVRVVQAVGGRYSGLDD